MKVSADGVAAGLWPRDTNGDWVSLTDALSECTKQIMALDDDTLLELAEYYEIDVKDLLPFTQQTVVAATRALLVECAGDVFAPEAQSYFYHKWAGNFRLLIATEERSPEALEKLRLLCLCGILDR